VGNHAVVKPLAALAGDERAQIRTRSTACLALGILGDPHPVPVLASLLRRSTGGEAVALAEALAAIGDRGGTSAVQDLVVRQAYAPEDEDRVRSALGKLGGGSFLFIFVQRNLLTLTAVLGFIALAVVIVIFARRRAARPMVVEEAPVVNKADRSPEQVLADLTAIIKRDAEGARLRKLHFKRGVLHFHEQRWEEAKTDLEEAHRVCSSEGGAEVEAYILYLLAKAYEHLGDKVYAFRKMTQSLKCLDKRALTETMAKIAGEEGKAEGAQASIRLLEEKLPFDEEIDKSMWT